MYLGASAFLIAVGLILIFGPRDSTRTLSLDLIGVLIAAAGVIGLLVNIVRRLRRRRAATRLRHTGTPITTPRPVYVRRRRNNA